MWGVLFKDIVQINQWRERQSGGHVTVKRYSSVQSIDTGLRDRGCTLFTHIAMETSPSANQLLPPSLLPPVLTPPSLPPSPPSLHISIAYQHMDYDKPTTRYFYSLKGEKKGQNQQTHVYSPPTWPQHTHTYTPLQTMQCSELVHGYLQQQMKTQNKETTGNESAI